jgi:hypothetical protein
MCLNRRKNPNATLPIATIFLAIAVLWPHIIHPSSHLGTDWNDFLRGGIMGLAIGMLLMTVIRMCRQGCGQQSQDPTENGSSPRP